MEIIVFALAAGAALVTAGIVVFHRNPVICALGLVGNLLSVAVLFLALGAQFIATLQVIVYAGAIMVLILFVIMLLALPREDRVLRARAGGGTLAAVAACATMLAALVAAIKTIRPAAPPSDPAFGTAAWVARELFTTWFYPFELVSLVLIAAMAGAILLAKREL